MPSDLRERRSAAIDRMYGTLRTVKQSERGAHWLILLSIPWFIRTVLTHAWFTSLAMIAEVLIALGVIILAPFRAMYMFVDLTLITTWFMRSVIQKMKGK